MQYKNFGRFIKAKREAIVPKIALNKFALDIGIDPATLCRIENLKQDTKLLTISKLAQAFDISVSELLYEYEQSEFAKMK